MSLPGKIIRFDETNKECVECTDKAKLKNQEWVCEKGCGADNECDERINGEFIAGKCVSCKFTGFSYRYVSGEFAVVCGEITSLWPEGADIGKTYELRIQRKSDPGTCGTDMSGFDLTYVIGKGYLITKGLKTAPINKNQINTGKEIESCKFDVDFKIN